MFIYFAFAILFFIECYKSLYPVEFQEMFDNILIILKPKLLTFSYNLIYYYSYLQIQFIRLKTKLMPYIRFICTSIEQYLKMDKIINSPDFPVPKCKFELYEKGIQQTNVLLPKETINALKDELEWNNLYDLVIWSDNNADYENKIHYYCFDLPFSFDYQLSNIKFMSVDLTYNNQVYAVDLKTDNYNHYIVNNKLNSRFFQYYLQNILNVTVASDNFDYTVNILDHNVNFVELTPNCELIIKENDYEIIHLHNNNNNNNNLDISVPVDNAVPDKETKREGNHKESDGFDSDEYITLEKPESSL